MLRAARKTCALCGRTTVFKTFLSTTLSDNNFVPKGWHDSVSDGGHSPAAQRLAVVDGNRERVWGKMSSLKKALWSSVRTYAYIVDVASMASRRWRRWRMIPTRSRTARKEAVSTVDAVNRKHLNTSRSMTSRSLWGSAQNAVHGDCSDRHVAP